MMLGGNFVDLMLAPSMAPANILYHGGATSDNKAYALHSLSLVRAAPNRGGKAAATSHKPNVIRHRHKNLDPASVPGKAKNFDEE